MTTAVLSLGSNVGDRLAHLQRAVDAFGWSVRDVSPVYETEPWGVEEDQNDYLNVILVVSDRAKGARDWLCHARVREQEAGRAGRRKLLPRTLDVDIITVDDLSEHDGELTLPHPRAHLRAFVLQPWLDVDPDAALPGHGRVADLLDAMSPAARSGVRRLDVKLSRSDRP